MELCTVPIEVNSFTGNLEPLKISKKKNKVKNKRRFSEEQTRLLESIFESDSKLEPRKKMQVAEELGLQPRQVAVWFQNRRARWKSKQVEKDYNKLRAKYDNLACQFKSLKKENHFLLIQEGYELLNMGNQIPGSFRSTERMSYEAAGVSIQPYSNLQWLDFLT